MPPASYLTDLFCLSGRRAVVTGGNSGIGAAIAEAIGRAGASLHLVARSTRRLGEAADRLTELGIVVEWLPVDLADPAELEALCRHDALHRCDILVTAAAINRRPPLDELGPDDYSATMAVNLDAPFRLGQAAAPRMAERGFGRIVNVGSQQSWSAFAHSGAYGISKAAIGGLTRAQAEAWSACGVTANAIVPGFVATPMTEATLADPARAAALAARTMVGRNGVPADFAGVAVFLASAASAYVTGQMIAVDGGFSVH